VAIARNRSIDRLRSQAMFRSNVPIEAALDVPDASPSAIEQLEISDDQARLRDCLEELEQRQSAAIRAAFLDGFTYEQLAEKASVPLGTMKSWIRRGLLKLRACLER
jgi:RNA polymerase sigma-70 factor (ECF subfamily)